MIDFRLSGHYRYTVSVNPQHIVYLEDVFTNQMGVAHCEVGLVSGRKISVIGRREDLVIKIEEALYD
jgi:hypothetical protein